MPYQFITAKNWRMIVNKASDGSLIKTIIPDESMMTAEGATIELEGGINNCKEASFTASGSLNIPALSRIAFQITEDNSTWYNLFRGELVMQPNKWNPEPGYYNVVGYRKHFYEIPLPDTNYPSTDVGKLIRHVMYDISGSGGAEFTRPNLQMGQPDLPPAPALRPDLLGPHINNVISKVPDIGQTAPKVVTNAELVGDLFEKIESYYANNLTPTKFGTDANGDFVFAPVNNDVLDMASHPDIQYSVDWPAMENERVITAVMWFLGRSEGDDKKLITWDYVDPILKEKYGLRYKRLILKNSEPFKVTAGTYSAYNNPTLTASLNQPATVTQLSTNSKKTGNQSLGFVSSVGAISGPPGTTPIILNPVPGSGKTSDPIGTGSIKVTTNTPATLIVNNQTLGPTETNGVTNTYPNIREGVWEVKVVPINTATYPRTYTTTISIRSGSLTQLSVTFSSGAVNPDSGAPTTPGAGNGEHIQLTLTEDYLRAWVMFSFKDAPCRIVHFQADGIIKEIFIYYPSTGTGTSRIVEKWLLGGKAGDYIRIYDKENTDEDASNTSMKASIFLEDMYAEGPNTALLIPYSKAHLEDAEIEPTEITIQAILINPPGKIQLLRPDGSTYLRRIDSVVYPISGDAFGTTIIKVGQPDDPFRKAQALAIGLRDEKAAIEAYSGNETFKTGL